MGHGPVPPAASRSAQLAAHRADGKWLPMFPRTVPRNSVLSQGRINPVQLAWLDSPLAELIPPRTDPARLDAS
jgi:hypothetical protein